MDKRLCAENCVYLERGTWTCFIVGTPCQIINLVYCRYVGGDMTDLLTCVYQCTKCLKQVWVVTGLKSRSRSQAHAYVTPVDPRDSKCVKIPINYEGSCDEICSGLNSEFLF